MVKPIQNVALVGAGGNLGPHVLDALLKAGFKVTVIARQSSTYQSSSTDIRVVRLPDSYPVEDLEDAFQGQDAVVCTVVPFSANDPRFRLVEAAVRAGVRRFIPAEFGLDMTPEALKVIPDMQQRLDVQKYYRSKESDTFSWTGIATGLFHDFGLGSANLFFIDVAARTARILEGGRIPFSTCTMPTIGLAVSRTLQRLEETKNQTLMIQSFVTTQHEILQTVEKVIGEKFAIVRHVSQADIIAESNKKQEAGDAAYRLDLICMLGMLEQDIRSKPEFANGILGIEMLDIEEATRDALRN